MWLMAFTNAAVRKALIKFGCFFKMTANLIEKCSSSVCNDLIYHKKCNM
jgi:hypothetical protein